MTRRTTSINLEDEVEDWLRSAGEGVSGPANDILWGVYSADKTEFIKMRMKQLEDQIKWWEKVLKNMTQRSDAIKEKGEWDRMREKALAVLKSLSPSSTRVEIEKNLKEMDWAWLADFNTKFKERKNDSDWDDWIERLGSNAPKTLEEYLNFKDKYA